MATSPFVVDRFGGLDLLNDPQETGASSAVDLLNVTFDRRGRLRTRDGYAKFTGSAASGDYLSLGTYYSTGGGTNLLAQTSGGTDVLRALNTSGASVATQSISSAEPRYTFAQIGTPAASLSYAGNGFSGPYKWDGSAWTAPTGTVDGVGSLALPRGAPYLYPTSNRLVYTCFQTTTLGPAGGASSPHHVWFSNAGEPEVWDSNNFLQLTPGDGQAIRGAATFGNALFVFKESRFFVFEGESIDSDGKPIFNYRTVDNGIGMAANVSANVFGGVTTGSDGVYFLGRRGIYRTSGGPPMLVSRILDPFFQGVGSLTLNQAYVHLVAMAWHDEKLWVSVPTGSATVPDRVLMFDPALDAWTVLGFPANGMVSWRVSGVTDLFFGYATGTNDIGRLGAAYTTDDGAAVSWSYKSGMYPLGDGASVAMTLESRVWGSGTATLKVANDDGALDTGSALTLGVAPAILDAWQQIDREGTYWQHQLSGSGVASVNRLAHYVSFVKPAGVQ